jgi:hypothetical protein
MLKKWEKIVIKKIDFKAEQIVLLEKNGFALSLPRALLAIIFFLKYLV